MGESKRGHGGSEEARAKSQKGSQFPWPIETLMPFVVLF